MPNGNRRSEVKRLTWIVVAAVVTVGGRAMAGVVIARKVAQVTITNAVRKRAGQAILQDVTDQVAAKLRNLPQIPRLPKQSCPGQNIGWHRDCHGLRK